MNKKVRCFVFVMLIIGSILLTSCKNESLEKDGIEVLSTETNKQNEQNEKIDSSITEITVEKQNEDDWYKEKESTCDMPYYYLDEYDIDFGKNSFSECGNQVACLSMVYSFYHPDTYVSPEAFYEVYASYIEQDGTVNKEVYKKMASDLGIQEFEEPFDVVTAATYLKLYRAKIIICINRPSIYGKGSSYILLNGLYDDKYMYIRDPNRMNIKEYSHEDEYGEPMYDVYELTEAMGTGNTMYVFY